jgi:hypothetical protein
VKRVEGFWSGEVDVIGCMVSEESVCGGYRRDNYMWSGACVSVDVTTATSLVLFRHEQPQ